MEPVRQARNLTIETDGVPVKAWVQGVPFDPIAREQVRRMAELPFVHGWVAVMPDVHVGKGATIGSVIPTRGAIVPAAVGVDLGCGMMAVETGIGAARLPDSLGPLRSAIEKAVPHGRSGNGAVSAVRTIAIFLSARDARLPCGGSNRPRDR